jgi:hypothetical protein
MIQPLQGALRVGFSQSALRLKAERSPMNGAKPEASATLIPGVNAWAREKQLPRSNPRRKRPGLGKSCRALIPSVNAWAREKEPHSHPRRRRLG